MQAVSKHQQLLKINRALLRVLAVKQFIASYRGQIKEKVFYAAETVVANIEKIKQVVGLFYALKLLHIPYSEYLIMKRKMCKQSLLNLCNIKHPAQLLKQEISIIKQYCTDERYQWWSLASVYHQIKRDSAAYFSVATFYKYVALLKLQRVKIKHRRKNHALGIRAEKPLQILHVDVMLQRLQDNTKAYIYMIQDNFSRTILSWQVALKCSAEFVLENLQKVKEQFLLPNAIDTCQVVSDDGSENNCIANFDSLHFKHVVAQKDIVQSNSMIEAANKQIKYRFLYYQTICTFEELKIYMQLAVEDYNNRPYDALNGLTPTEVLNGKLPMNVSYYEKTIIATQNRLLQNKLAKCCSYSF